MASKLTVAKVMVYAADADADWADPATWERADPSLPYLPALRAVYEREAQEAHADPSLLPAFRALRCNMGAVDHEIAVLIEAADWQRCEADIQPAAAGPCVWGVDLSGGDAMASVACYWPSTGRLEALAALPALPSLEDRSRTDAADYQTMHADGDLIVMGGRVVPVADLIGAALDRWGTAGADRGRLPP